MGFRVAHGESHAYEERPGLDGVPIRLAADLTAALALQSSRARLWRYPPHARGRRHLDLGQEEVFLVVGGTLTVLLGDPPERFDLPPRSVVSLERGTPIQLRNESDDELVLFAYGAPPVVGKSEFLEDVPEL